MNKRKLLSAILLTAGIICSACGCTPKNLIHWLISAQYNEKGISHFLVITVDKDQAKEYIGILDGHDIYAEKLNIDETNFRSIDAEKVSMKEAFENKLVSIEEWRKYARRIKKNGDTEILRFDNYEITVTSDECIIRPVNR